jgi:hypothetical protein
MGYDVYGKAATAEVGKYFRNNIWWWHPLWSYCEEIAPDLTEGVIGHSNDGDGLDDVGACTLAELLTAELSSRRTAQYGADEAARLATLPDEPCSICQGTGVRTDKIGRDAGMDVRGWCNGCDGKGANQAWLRNYVFSVENVAAFRDFVAANGGFEIW